MKGKRRWLEVIKSLLILLLSASAIFLLTMTPLVQDSGVLDLLTTRQPDSVGSTEVTLTAAAIPSRMAVRSGTECYGVQYDQNSVDELFARLGPLLGEALVSSTEQKIIGERLWRRYLQGEGIYFDFTGDIPLSALSSWLQPEGFCGLTAAARRILLASADNDKVLLCYQDAGDGRFYACDTALTWSLHLAPAVSDISGNDAEFAFDSQTLSGLLEPYTLITEDSTRKIYNATTPLSVGGDLSDLLEALEYTGRNHASVSGGELYLDGNDRLQIQAGGQVSYTAAQPGKYPVATAGEEMTIAEAIEAARQLAESTIGAKCGEAELYLQSAQEVSDGYLIYFGYRLDGSMVWLYDKGWAAEFYVRYDHITDFTLYFRSYVSTGADALLLSMDRAAGMLPNLVEQSCELIIQYRDQGESQVQPVWVAK